MLFENTKGGKRRICPPKGGRTQTSRDFSFCQNPRFFLFLGNDVAEFSCVLEADEVHLENGGNYNIFLPRTRWDWLGKMFCTLTFWSGMSVDCGYDF